MPLVFSRFCDKTIDKSPFCGKITKKCKGIAETKICIGFPARGEWCEPLMNGILGHFQAAREDRDGRSRYRASKISYGIIRVVPRFSRPYV